MISTFLLLFITLAIPQQIQSIHQIQNTITPVDQTYMDDCKAVLQGKDYPDQQNPTTWKTTYSNWENTNPSGSLLGFFENDKGIVSKIWNNNAAAWSGGWAFNLTFYNGEVVDGKFALVEFDLRKIQSGDFNQSIGNFTKTTSQDFTLYVSYGEDGEIQNRDDIQGQLFINFFDTSAQKPITAFDVYSDLQEDTVLITFISDDDSLSFTTSLFTDSYPISEDETNLVYFLTLLYVICSLYSANTSELVPQLSFGSLVGTYTASSFIVLWAFLHMPLKTNLLYFLPFIAAIIDWIKQAIFLLSRSSCGSSCGALFVSTFFAIILSSLPTIWVNLLPALTLLFPLFAKIASQSSRQKHYLTKYQICYWICVSMWMGYFYCSPNIYLISSQPLLAKIFFGIILFQFVLSFLMHKMQRVNSGPPLLPQRRRQIPEEEPNSQPRNDFKYTFAAQQGGDYTELTDECVICHDLLLGDLPDKLYKTPCGHIFHENCLRAWGEKKLDCPSCRKKLPKFQNQNN